MNRYGCPHSISPKFAELVSSVFETILLITFLAISIRDCGIDVKVETLDPTLDALNEICLTFDDGLKSQYDVALPILNDFNIKAFFFISTSVYTSNPNLLEVYLDLPQCLQLPQVIDG